MLLFRWLRLWYCPQFRTNNTEAHAACIDLYANKRVHFIHTNEHLGVAMFWN